MAMSRMGLSLSTLPGLRLAFMFTSGVRVLTPIISVLGDPLRTGTHSA
ncbi:hypothetical protein [Prauserella marina]|nr:hypothetical protein [Prauserella marina]